MIAKVRIAPVEQWCATGQEAPAELAGMEAEIETTSMERDNSIAEREWQVVGGPALEAMKRFAPGYARYFFCEHMLEMD